MFPLIPVFRNFIVFNIVLQLLMTKCQFTISFTPSSFTAILQELEGGGGVESVVLYRLSNNNCPGRIMNLNSWTNYRAFGKCCHIRKLILFSPLYWTL